MRTDTNTWQRRTILATTITALLALGNIASAESITEALTGGQASVDVRLRYENVDQDNALDDADGLTVRTRLGYATGEYKAFSGYVEMENNSALIEDYNSGPNGNGKTRYSVISDPDATEVNQAFIGFSGITNTPIKAGRQRIILDNARFVGNVGWRQLEQTFDAARITNTSLADTTLTYAYIDNVRDIFSSDVDVSSHILNASYTGFALGTITGYGYFIDFKDLESASQQTLGIRFDGSRELEGFKLLYLAEYAQQSDYEDGSNDIDADYNHFMIGASAGGITGQLGYELLGGDDFSGFETPFATKHAFNGWADVFLNTPTDGLQDLYLLVSGDVRGIKLTGVYHEFEADKGGDDYGTELDLLASKSFGKNYSAGLKYATYDSDDYAVDTEKFWLWGELKF